MPVSQYGDINLTGLIVPDIYVQIVPPQTVLLNGVPTNIAAVVGSASWGPVNSPTVFGSMAAYAQIFGAVKNRKYDMGTIAATAVQQGANNLRGVRVTDGTDTKAQALVLKGTPTVSSGGSGYVVGEKLTLSNGAILQVATVSTGAVATVTTVKEPTAATSGTITQTSSTAAGTGATFTFTYANGLTVSSAYTGSLANGDAVTIANGSQAGSYKLIVSRAGAVPEVFDNITGSANALWVAMAAALNGGIAGQRSKSNLVAAAAGAATAVPTLGTYTLAGGTDGAGSVTATLLVGTDGTSRTGMYALRGTGASLFALADCDTSSTWPAQVAFALSEGMEAMLVNPSGQAIGDSATLKVAAGVDSYGCKLLHGDWVYWLDTVNGLTRLVSPQGFALGRLANLSPEQSALNKPMYGIVGTERSYAGQIYTSAELLLLAQAGVDVITMSSPGGSYPGLRIGHNGSSNPAINGDNYTRMTNYLAQTLNAGMGGFIGKLQGRTDADPTRRACKGAIDSFLDTLKSPSTLTGYGMIDDFQTICDKSNNPDDRIALGYLQVDVKVVYLGIVEKLIVNVEGGTTVQITRASTLPLAA